jgi:hypothetical protein
MGFFKKLFKGVKKVFKKIGKGIKKAVGKVGKFMGKLGIVGQIGLGLLLPGIGSMMGSMFSSLAGSLATSSIGILRGAGQVINAAVKIGTKAGNVFSSITEGVTKVVGEVAGATLNKLGVKNIGTVSLEGKGFGSIWETASTAIKDVAEKGGDLFSMDTLSANNLLTTQAEQAVSQAAVSPDGGVFDAPGIVETAVPEGTLGDAVEGFRAAQEVSAPAVDYSTFDPATGGTFVDAATTQAAATTQPSLLARAGSAIVSRTKEAVTDIPGQFSQAAIANLTAIPRDVVRSAMAPTPEVTYNVRQPAIPDIGFAGIGQEFAQPAFDPISYFDQNQATFNQSPFGFGAALYGEATYARNMQSYGFQAPMYGMS